MKTIFHPADSRGYADHGWLKSHHSFSFANYYNPERMNFGMLRVLNDDSVNGGMGFGTHPHKDMEIVSIPLSGDLEHKDSMGNTTVIREGDIQVMSAGTGVQHSEKNKNRDQTVKFLQIWVIPNTMNVEPRYDQITLDPADRKNKLQQVLSPDKIDAGVWVHQDAWFYLGSLESGLSIDYSVKKPGNGVYVFVLSGKLSVENHELNSRDGLGITEASQFSFSAKEISDVLLMEVPMG
ncbi:MAG: pirin family protein [Leeuwenhoekiella sp.]